MIGTFSFYLTDEVKKSQRNYSNLLDILGNIAGLINFLTLVLKILTFPLQRYFYNSFFTYEFFSIADADGNNKKS